MARYKMAEQYTEINGVLIDDKEFQTEVDFWAYAVTKEMKAEIVSLMPHQSHALANSVKPRIIKKGGNIQNVSIGFYRSGIFQAYGVGKYLIHTKAGVIRGRKHEYAKTKTKLNKFSAGFASYNPGAGALNRKPKDWFDTLISNRVGILSDLVSSYYGDVFILAASAGSKIIK